MTRFERFSLWASTLLGIIGCGIGAASWYQSSQALNVSKAASRANLDSVGFAFSRPLKNGEFIEYRLELKNFGQATASDISLNCNSPYCNIAFMQKNTPAMQVLAPGAAEPLLVVTGRPYDSEPQMLFAVLRYVDSVSRQVMYLTVCYEERHDSAGVFDKCQWVRTPQGSGYAGRNSWKIPRDQ